jgi:hypothetical protein
MRKRNYEDPIVQMNRFANIKEISIVFRDGRVEWMKFDHALKLAMNLLCMVVGQLVSTRDVTVPKISEEAKDIIGCMGALDTLRKKQLLPKPYKSPDKNCVTTPDGGCKSTKPCMHTKKG